ncbi:hypothetical protein, variant [Allomyces macrogynus ATCC 38327]|nr:hypothetical protein, variant [Allomyces macrogynus ATCC 38327]|eukprot:KNE68344.1 hypothetical protein, variant [Allomyces macrogynus ATCC 38327]
MLNPIRTAVSKKKRRFRGDGFDLDLAYITDRIIAMGYPSESVEGLYRNPLQEVVKFLDLKHKDHYKVYNLCSERCYDPAKFYGRVEHIPFEDHNAPPFDLIEVFCRSVQAWLDADAANVAAVHCKAGKGRTGVMICAYLLFSGHSKDPTTAMEFYGRARTHNGHGVTIPSQQRYINYWHLCLRNHLTYTPTERYLTRLTLRAPPGAATAAALGDTHSGVQVTVAAYSNGQRVFAFKNLPVLLDPVDPYDELPPTTAAVPLPHPCRLAGDVRMHLQFELAEKFGKEKPFHFWFNTFFTTLPETVLGKSEIDKCTRTSTTRSWMRVCRGAGVAGAGRGKCGGRNGGSVDESRGCDVRSWGRRAWGAPGGRVPRAPRYPPRAPRRGRVGAGAFAHVADGHAARSCQNVVGRNEILGVGRVVGARVVWTAEPRRQHRRRWGHGHVDRRDWHVAASVEGPVVVKDGQVGAVGVGRRARDGEFRGRDHVADVGAQGGWGGYAVGRNESETHACGSRAGGGRESARNDCRVKKHAQRDRWKWERDRRGYRWRRPRWARGET